MTDRPDRITSSLDLIARINQQKTHDRCLVPPHPELRDRLKAAVQALRESADRFVARMIEIREPQPPGFNDGLIYPGSLFPVGTPLSVARSAAADRAPLTGTVNVIVVPVDFADRPMVRTQAEFNDPFFSNNVIASGSVREYFTEASHGLITIAGQVVPTVRLPQNLAAYAKNQSGTGTAQPNARTMAYDAAVAANATVNFAPYDNNGDGFIDAFIVIHAGPGAEVTGSPGDIWSHKWVLPSAYTADTKQIYAYLTVPEDARIGVCAHELGHLLFGWPDLTTRMAHRKASETGASWPAAAGMAAAPGRQIRLPGARSTKAGCRSSTRPRIRMSLSMT